MNEALAKEADRLHSGITGASAIGFGHENWAAQRMSDTKLQIFHSILQLRCDLSPLSAAEEAEKVYQRLCIPHPPAA